MDDEEAAGEPGDGTGEGEGDEVGPGGVDREGLGRQPVLLAGDHGPARVAVAQAAHVERRQRAGVGKDRVVGGDGAVGVNAMDLALGHGHILPGAGVVIAPTRRYPSALKGI